MKFKETLSIKFIILVLLITSAIGIGFFLYSKNSKKLATAEKPNIIIISVDTLRADHLGTYGYKRDTSPNIDEFAKKSIVFDNAFTPIPWTIASYASLFTGTYPLKHQVFTNKLDKKIPTMAEILKENDYKTAGIVSSNVLSSNLNNLDRGFDYYDDVNEKDSNNNPEDTYTLKWFSFDNTSTNSGSDSGINTQRARQTTNEASFWLENNNKKNFFLFLHYFDPHMFYDAPEPFKSKFSSELPKNDLEDIEQQRILRANYSQKGIAPKDIEYLKAKYDEEIAYTDFYIGELLKKIESLGLGKNTIIIITADHGESFDHEYLGHGQRLYDSSIKIPLIIYDPMQKESKRIKDVVSLIDILPTLMSRLKIDKKIDSDGIDLNILLNSENIGRKTLFLMSLPAVLPYHTPKYLTRGEKYIGQLYATVTKEKRLTYNENSNQKELYDINTDLGENDNLYNENDKNSVELFEKLILWLSQNKNIDTENLKIKNEELYKTLKGLGYL